MTPLHKGDLIWVTRLDDYPCTAILHITGDMNGPTFSTGYFEWVWYAEGQWTPQSYISSSMRDEWEPLPDEMPDEAMVALAKWRLTHA